MDVLCDWQPRRKFEVALHPFWKEHCCQREQQEEESNTTVCTVDDRCYIMTSVEVSLRPDFHSDSCYTILGCGKSKSPEEIRKAYRDLSRKVRNRNINGMGVSLECLTLFSR